eukprot:TRINITY_DN3788_c0_g1_i3.p1 TRINITY_DN3788_c0_g1~~TRINITY_DN3788_c0_g1_i3.p1  ORF type:complete len:116 (+),score=5.88 TRINITY_DN3788_c0_g1_i3:1572-1919(+)
MKISKIGYRSNYTYKDQYQEFVGADYSLHGSGVDTAPSYILISIYLWAHLNVNSRIFDIFFSMDISGNFYKPWNPHFLFGTIMEKEMKERTIFSLTGHLHSGKYSRKCIWANASS